MNRIAPIPAPARRPIARLIAPEPAIASPIEVSAPTQTVTWSISIRVCCLNSRSISAAGEATAPLRITVSPSS